MNSMENYSNRKISYNAIHLNFYINNAKIESFELNNFL